MTLADDMSWLRVSSIYARPCIGLLRIVSGYLIQKFFGRLVCIQFYQCHSQSKSSFVSTQFPKDKQVVPDVAYFCQPEGTHFNSSAGENI